MSDDGATTPPAKARRFSPWLLTGGALLLAAVALPAVRFSKVDTPAFMAELAEFARGRGSVMRIESSSPEGRMKISLRGKIVFNDAEDDVQDLDGALEIKDERDGHVRRLAIVNVAGVLQRSFERDGQTVSEPDAQDRQWLAGVIAVLIDSTRSPASRVERLMTRGGTEAVFKAISAHPHEYQRRAMLQALMERGPAEGPRLDRALQAAGQLSSDHERRNALETIAERQTLVETQQQAYLQAAAGMGSDFEHREALNALAPQLGSTPAVLEAWVAAVRQVGSDFEIRTAVETLMRRKGLSLGQAMAALQACRHIDGDFERREALVTVIATGLLDKPGYLSVFDAAAGIGSGHELLQLLTAAARHMPADTELIARYRQLSRALSDHERGQAEKALDRFSA